MVAENWNAIKQNISLTKTTIPETPDKPFDSAENSESKSEFSSLGTSLVNVLLTRLRHSLASLWLGGSAHIDALAQSRSRLNVSVNAWAEPSNRKDVNFNQPN